MLKSKFAKTVTSLVLGATAIGGITYGASTLLSEDASALEKEQKQVKVENFDSIPIISDQTSKENTPQNKGTKEKQVEDKVKQVKEGADEEQKLPVVSLNQSTSQANVTSNQKAEQSKQATVNNEKVAKERKQEKTVTASSQSVTPKKETTVKKVVEQPKKQQVSQTSKPKAEPKKEVKPQPISTSKTQKPKQETVKVEQPQPKESSSDEMSEAELEAIEKLRPKHEDVEMIGIVDNQKEDDSILFP